MSSTEQLPEARLEIIWAQTNPPKPLGCDVIVGGKPIAVLSADELLRAVARVYSYDARPSVGQ